MADAMEIRLRMKGGKLVEGELKGVRRETERFGSAASRSSRRAGSATSRLTEHYKDLGRTAKRAFGIASVAAGYLAARGLADVVTKGMAFEKQMSVNAAVAEANAHQMGALEAQSIRLGKATFYSAKEAAEAQGELVKGGLSVGQVLGGALPAALNLAEAGQLELAEAATTTVNAMKLFGLGGKDAGSIADMLATAANKTTADVLDFSEALKYGGSVSKLSGYSLNETVTVLESLAEAGIKGSMAGTTMKTAFSHLLAPTAKQTSLQKELGLEILTSNGHLKSAAGLSRELHKALEGKTDAERTAILVGLAGQRGVIGLNALYSKTPGYLEALEKANAKQGTAQEVASKKMDNFAGAWENFRGTLETVELQIYKGIEPSMKSLVGEADTVVEHIGGIFDNRHLTSGQKIERSLEYLTREFDRFWKKNDIGEHLVDGLEAAIPVVASNAGRLGITMAAALGEGFVHSNLIGKVAIGTYVFNLLGGKEVAKIGARKVGGMMGTEMGLGLAAGATGAFIAYELWEHLSKRTQSEIIHWGQQAGADFVNFFVREINKSLNEANPFGNLPFGLSIHAPQIHEVGGPGPLPSESSPNQVGNDEIPAGAGRVHVPPQHSPAEREAIRRRERQRGQRKSAQVLTVPDRAGSGRRGGERVQHIHLHLNDREIAKAVLREAQSAAALK